MSAPVQRVVLAALTCPVCGKYYQNGSVYALACDPPITVYPCGCRQQFVHAPPPSTEGGEDG